MALLSSKNVGKNCQVKACNYAEIHLSHITFAAKF